MSETAPPANETESIHHLEEQRRANAEALRGLGLEVYDDCGDSVVTTQEAKDAYDEEADQDQQANGKNEGFEDTRPVVSVGGRVVLHRDNGKLVWINLRDAGGEIQVAVSKRDCDEAGFGAAKTLDLGDVVRVSGPVMKTRTGEITVWASSLRSGAKCLVPPPEKRAGLSDVESRYRQRYVDLWSNPDSTRVFMLRAEMIRAVRSLMEERGYIEVETPMLQPQAGGAAARPFVTHMNALDIDLYMRIAPELYLKRLLVGGMPRVFEINRNFRNEGLDKQHNPEFTMLEAYHAWGDVETIMELTESVVRRGAEVAAAARAGEEGVDTDGLVLPFGELKIGYAEKFARVEYGELFERVLGFDMADTGRAREEAAKRGIKTKNEQGVEIDDALVVNELFEDVAEPTLDPATPTFITKYPAAISPLTRADRARPELSDRADLFIGGMEISPNYTELNDPDVQAGRFRAQLAGADDEETTYRNFDEDFIRALRVGMPPAGGMGLGIDRMAMLMTGAQTIRDVVLFPLLRPEA